jgi:dienelactone hydrolase
MFFSRVFAATLLLALSPLVKAQMPTGELIEAKGATTAVILAHGRGHGPDDHVVGPLRRAIAKDAGLTTLSLQMPVLPNPNYLAYSVTFPDSYKALQAAVDYLINEKGVKRIYFLGYSMGARMTAAFLALHGTPAVVGYVGVGLLEGGGEPLDANASIRKLRIPVLDLYADSTPLDLSSAENRKTLIGQRYRQVRINGANHSFKGHESELSREVVSWLKDQEARQ